MENNSRLKKKIIGRFATIFIVALIILTFFSNTIMNYSLPEVSTVPVTNGTVAQKVRCQGTVEVGENFEVTVSGSRTVKEVLVKNGDMVEKGQILMTFDETEDSEVSQAEATLKELEKTYKRSLQDDEENDYSDDLLAIQEAEEALSEAKDALSEAETNETLLESAKSDVSDKEYEVRCKQDEIDDLEIEAAGYPSLEEYYGYKAEVSEYEDKISTAEGELKMLTDATAIDLKKAEIKEYKEAMNSAQYMVDTLSDLPGIYESIAEKKAELEDLNLELGELQEKVSTLSAAVTVKDAKASVEEKQKTLDSLNTALEKKKKKDEVTAENKEEDNEEALAAIEKQRKLVEKLKAASDVSEIKAGAAGEITGMSIKAGDQVSADAPLATIELVENGFEVETVVTKKESKLLKVGDEADIENVWTDDVTAVVKSIKADPSNPNQSSIVKFEVKGNVSIGETLQFAVGGKSGKYDTVVPNNAVKEDSEGKAVLVVKVKSTPLGNRYTVKKVKVEVVASDTVNSAIMGDISEWDNVITNASKALDNGQQVRLSEKQ